MSENKNRGKVKYENSRIQQKVNLLKETIECLKDNGKDQKDVLWVGNKGFWFSWERFSESSDFEYDAYFGKQIINKFIVVVGDSWWLERHEYDGSEWWEFKEIPSRLTKVYLEGPLIFRSYLVKNPREYYLNEIIEHNKDDLENDK